MKKQLFLSLVLLMCVSGSVWAMSSDDETGSDTSTTTHLDNGGVPRGRNQSPMIKPRKTQSKNLLDSSGSSDSEDLSEKSLSRSVSPKRDSRSPKVERFKIKKEKLTTPPASEQDLNDQGGSPSVDGEETVAAFMISKKGKVVLERLGLLNNENRLNVNKIEQLFESRLTTKKILTDDDNSKTTKSKIIDGVDETAVKKCPSSWVSKHPKMALGGLTVLAFGGGVLAKTGWSRYRSRK